MKSLILLLLLSVSPVLAVDDDKESFFEKMARYHNLIDSLVKGSLDSRGLSPDALFKPNLPSYNLIAEDINNIVKASGCQSTDCDFYEKDFSLVVGTNIGKAEEIRLLPNLESFEMRRELIRNAKKSIHVLVWAVYNDETGQEFRDLLLEALENNPGIDIRLIVDGNIANLKGKKVLKYLDKKSEGKIRIMKWKSRRYRANGNHRKLMIVDGEHVIVGGINIGNNYSHMATKDKWRDLDMYIRGQRAALNADNQFSIIWNKQLTEFPKLLNKLGQMEIHDIKGSEEGPSVLFVDQHPGSAVKESYHHIHTGIVKLFRDARETIDIENAYFIMDPIIKKELEKVLKRGVKVRIFTNSDKSVDEQIVSMPIMNSARDAVTMGAKVYLRQTTTLHSKYMVVDGKISVIGSFNFHPRSLRFDAENVAVIFDEKVAQDLTNHFNEAVREERYFDDPSLFKIRWDIIGFLTKSFYFDFL